MLREDVEDELRAVYARGELADQTANMPGNHWLTPTEVGVWLVSHAGVGVRIHRQGDSVQTDPDSRVCGPGRLPTARSPRSGASPCDYGVEPARATWSEARLSGARRGHPRRGARRSPPRVVELGARSRLYPRIGEKDVDQVTTADVMSVLVPLWTRRHATTRKLRQAHRRCDEMAVAQGYRTDNAISAALPKRTNPARHMPALPHGEIAGAIEAVNASSAWVGTKVCFEFMVLTGVDRGQARRSARCKMGRDRLQRVGVDDSGDADEGESRAPSSAVRSRRRDPACGSTTARGSTTAQPGGLVFPSARGKQLADARLSKLLEQLGIGAVPHGFRSSFRDWVSERTNHPREVVEAALAHVVRNQTEAAYARSDLFDRRRQLMTDGTRPESLTSAIVA